MIKNCSPNENKTKQEILSLDIITSRQWKFDGKFLNFGPESSDGRLDRLVGLELFSPVDQLRPADGLHLDGQLERAIEVSNDCLDVRRTNTPVKSKTKKVVILPLI